MKHQVLFDNGRYNVSQYRDYSYFHHWSGMSIAVLPILALNCKIWIRTLTPPKSLHKKVRFPREGGNNYCYPNERLYGFRREDLPCWQAGYEGPDQLHWTCVTGGKDEHDKSIPDAMYRELREEMGIVVKTSTCETEGPMHNGKGTNLQVVHFVLTIEEAEYVGLQDPPESQFEANAEVHWLTTNEVRETSFDLHSRHLLKMARFQ